MAILLASGKINPNVGGGKCSTCITNKSSTASAQLSRQTLIQAI